MTMDPIARPPWHGVLEFWFPEDSAHELDAMAHLNYWRWRMRGEADRKIVERFSDLAGRAAQGRLGHWAAEPGGRLALIIVLDQFSRSVWRGTPKAYAQDPAALALTQRGIANGDYAALKMPWHRVVFGLPLGHCEGVGHLERIDQLIQLRMAIALEAPAGLQPIYQSLVQQARNVRRVIAAFGRHPHRNEVLARASTSPEQEYVANGRFPHLKAFNE